MLDIKTIYRKEINVSAAELCFFLKEMKNDAIYKTKNGLKKSPVQINVSSYFFHVLKFNKIKYRLSTRINYCYLSGHREEGNNTLRHSSRLKFS